MVLFLGHSPPPPCSQCAARMQSRPTTKYAVHWLAICFPRAASILVLPQAELHGHAPVPATGWCRCTAPLSMPRDRTEYQRSAQWGAKHARGTLSDAFKPIQTPPVCRRRRLFCSAHRRLLATLCPAPRMLSVREVT